GGPRRPFGAERAGILTSRFLRRDPGVIAQARGDLANDRSLRTVAIAAAPEHHAEAPRRDLACRRQHPLERIGGMGVIDDDEKWLPRPHLLEPAGHRLHTAERAGD